LVVAVGALLAVELELVLEPQPASPIPTRPAVTTNATRARMCASRFDSTR
jgi:hypothetical protein